MYLRFTKLKGVKKKKKNIKVNIKITPEKAHLEKLYNTNLILSKTIFNKET